MHFSDTFLTLANLINIQIPFVGLIGVWVLVRGLRKDTAKDLLKAIVYFLVLCGLFLFLFFIQFMVRGTTIKEAMEAWIADKKAAKGADFDLNSKLTDEKIEAMAKRFVFESVTLMALLYLAVVAVPVALILRSCSHVYTQMKDRDRIAVSMGKHPDIKRARRKMNIEMA